MSEALLDDPTNLPVIEDMMRIWEGDMGALPGKRSAAHLYWLEHGDASPKERSRTLFVVDEHTTEESYGPPDPPKDVEPWRVESAVREWKRNGQWTFWFFHARKMILKHPNADRVRVVKPDGHYHPGQNEVVIVLRKKNYKLYVDDKCAVIGCLHGKMF